MRFIKWTLILIFGSVLATIIGFILLCSGYLIYKSIERDVSQDERFENIVGKTFELQKDVILYECPDTEELCVEPTGKFSGLPSSVDEYLNLKNAVNLMI